MSSQIAGTAIGPMVAVAIEQSFAPGQRLITDDVAYRFLPRALRAVLTLIRVELVRTLAIGLVAVWLLSHRADPCWASGAWQSG